MHNTYYSLLQSRHTSHVAAAAYVSWWWGTIVPAARTCTIWEKQSLQEEPQGWHLQATVLLLQCHVTHNRPDWRDIFLYQFWRNRVVWGARREVTDTEDIWPVAAVYSQWVCRRYDQRLYDQTLPHRHVRNQQ